jgi:hypothetical protein
MFGKTSNKQHLLNHSSHAAFKRRIAPKIAAHISKPIDVHVAGEDSCLNAWLIENLSTIVPLHVTLATGGRPHKLQKTCPRKA